jgi:hypothetical protein
MNRTNLDILTEIAPDIAAWVRRQDRTETAHDLTHRIAGNYPGQGAAFYRIVCNALEEVQARPLTEWTGPRVRPVAHGGAFVAPPRNPAQDTATATFRAGLTAQAAQQAEMDTEAAYQLIAHAAADNAHRIDARFYGTAAVH